MSGCSSDFGCIEKESLVVNVISHSFILIKVLSLTVISQNRRKLEILFRESSFPLVSLGSFATMAERFGGFNNIYKKKNGRARPQAELWLGHVQGCLLVIRSQIITKTFY